MNDIGVIGPLIQICLDQITQLLETSGPILLIGKRGTGKDHLAKLIHCHLLGKSSQNFEIQNCAHPKQTLLEELCGYVNYDEYNVWDNIEPLVVGRLDLASQGTLYLDQIHLTPSDSIELIVAILAGQPFYPKGSVTPRFQENIQIIASCNPHPFDGDMGYLHEQIRSYFRGRTVVIPDLAIRREEIPELLNYFCINEYQNILGNVPKYNVDPEFIENAGRIFDNLKGLRAIAKRFINQNPQGGNITWALASEYIERKILQQAKDEQLRYRCEQISFNLRYQGELLNGEKFYTWLMQFKEFQGQIAYDPVDIGETLLKHICERYFFTEAKVIKLLNSMQVQLISEIVKELSVNATPKDRSSGALTLKANQITREALKIASQLVVTTPLGPMKSSDAMSVDYGISLNGISLKYRKIAKLYPKINACEFEKLGEWYSGQSSKARVVVVDDFIGSGIQIEKTIRKIIDNRNLLIAYQNHRQKPPVTVYLLICVAFSDGIRRAESLMNTAPEWMKIKLISGKVLNNMDRAFTSDSSIFPNMTIRVEAEKLIVKLIGKRIHPIAPRGFKDMESLVVFEHNIPNDSLPILYKDCQQGSLRWRAIFPRMKTAEN